MDLVWVEIPVAADNLGIGYNLKKHYAKTRPTPWKLHEMDARNLTNDIAVVDRCEKWDSRGFPLMADAISGNFKTDLESGLGKGLRLHDRKFWCSYSTAVGLRNMDRSKNQGPV